MLLFRAFGLFVLTAVAEVLGGGLWMGTVAFVLSTVILTILALEHPFSGGIRLSTQEVEEILGLLRRP